MRTALLLCLVLLASISASGQQVYSRNYTVNDGLPSNTVRCIYKDSHNRMWIGTAAGLCLYDGQEFRVVGDPNHAEMVQSGSLPERFNSSQPAPRIRSSMPASFNVIQHNSKFPSKREGDLKTTRLNYQSLKHGVWLSGEVGMAGENIFCLTEDAYGALWIGSVNGGLTRFDGREFRHYTVAHGLVSNNIRELYYSAQLDLLFIGTDLGFSVFNGSTFHSFTSAEDPEPYVMSFREGPGYMDVLPYARFRMWRYHPATGSITVNRLFQSGPLQLVSPRPSASPVMLPNGDTLLGLGRKGFYVLNNGVRKSFTGLGQVFDMTVDPDGNAWLAAWSETPSSKDMPGGLYKYDGSECIRFSEKVGINDPTVWGVYFDPDFGILWVGTLNSGLYKIPMSPFEWFSSKDLPPNPENTDLNIFSLLVTSSGDLFAGGKSFILHLPATANPASTIQHSGISGFRWLDLDNVIYPNHNMLFEFKCLKEDSYGNLYATVHSPALIQFSAASNYNHSEIQYSYESTQHFALDTRDTVWHGNKWFEGVVKTTLLPHQGNALNSYVQGLSKAGKQYNTEEVIKYLPQTSGAPKFVVSVKARSDTMWYISRYDGLFRSIYGRFENLNLTQLDFVPPHSAGVYYDKPELPKNLRDMCFDESGNLYLGTDAGDVWILGYNSRGVFVKKILHGGTDIVGNAVKFLVFDKQNHLWVGTNLGLNKLTLPAKGTKYHSQVHGNTPNSITNQFYDRQTGYFDYTGSVAVCDHQGNLWIGTNQHLLHVNTGFTQLHAPNLLITALDINMEPANPKILKDQRFIQTNKNKGIGQTDQFVQTLKKHQIPKFRYYQNNFVFYYASKNYLNPRSDLYRFKVEGLTDRWTEYSSDTKAVLTSLNPGTYTFRVEAINSLSNHTKSATSFTFTIQAPWYDSIWAYISMAVILIAVTALIIRQRETRIRQQEQQKTLIARQLATLEMRALQSQMNPHFIFNCINSIQGLILKNKTQEASGYLLDFSRLMRLTLEFASRERISLDDELQYLHHYLKLEEMRFDRKFSVHMQLDPSVSSEMVMIPPMIIQPHIENAIQHGLMPKSNGDGRLNISFIDDGPLFRCIIEDNGVGRPHTAQLSNGNGSNNFNTHSNTQNNLHDSTHQHHSFSTRITRERIQILNQNLNTTEGRIDIEDLTDENGDSAGTRVTIIIPV